MQPDEIAGLPEVTRTHRGRPYRIPDDPIVCGVFQAEEDLRGAHWLIDPGDVVVDVGAHFGSYTLPALACGATVYAVDPDPDATPILAAICALNPELLITGRLVILPVALVDAGLTPYFRAALEKLPHPSMACPLDCEYSSLDQVAEEQGLDRLDWVKIDVEGLELAVLRGGERTLRQFSPTVLVEDHSPLYSFAREMDSKQECIEFLEGLGYHVDTSLRAGAYLLATK